MLLKERFLNAVVSGQLGHNDDYGVVVELKDFKKYFNDIQTQYINSFLPAATIETGQHSISHTKYLFRIGKGLYRVHPEAIKQKEQYS